MYLLGGNVSQHIKNWWWECNSLFLPYNS